MRRARGWLFELDRCGDVVTLLRMPRDGPTDIANWTVAQSTDAHKIDERFGEVPLPCGLYRSSKVTTGPCAHGYAMQAGELSGRFFSPAVAISSKHQGGALCTCDGGAPLYGLSRGSGCRRARWAARGGGCTSLGRVPASRPFQVQA